MRELKDLFLKRKLNYNSMVEYGFKENDGFYFYKKRILGDEFEVVIQISDKVQKSYLIDLQSNMEYVLVDVDEAKGEYVGKVREEYNNIINDVINKCTIFDNFIFKQTKRIINYIEQKYDDKLEYLWDDFDGAAIRNKVNDKWYLVYMVVKENKIRSNCTDEKIIEIIDVKYNKDRVENVIDNVGIYPGYHMNKHSWITITLDDKVDDKIIFDLIDNSFILSGGNKTYMNQSDLALKIYEYLTKIPKGKVVTYGQIAEYLGNKGLSRVVGTALHKNPDGDKYPCYKVLNSKGELASSYVFGGAKIQQALLEKDGIEVNNNKVDLKKYKWKE